MTRGRRHARRRSALLLAAAALTAIAVVHPARAQEPFDPGVLESSYVNGCPILGQPGILTRGIDARAVLPNRATPPAVGEVFRAAAVIDGVGDPCMSQAVLVEVVPPAGVELAISPQEPLRCLRIDAPGQPEVPQAGCPQAPGPGSFGTLLAQTTRADGLWEVPLGGRIVLEFPLRASRPLTGLAGGGPSCGRIPASPANRGGSFPCPPALAGDALQVAVRVVDGQGSPWLVPHNFLTVRAGAGQAPPTAPAQAGVLRTAPRRVRIARALRGIPITVVVPEAASSVVAELRAKRLGGARRMRLARVTRRNVRAGELKLRLRPTGRARRALRRARSVTATLSVTVRPRSGAARTASATIRLRR